MNDNNVITLNTDFEKLKADVEKIRVELSMLVLERDNLLFQECKNIEMAYMLAVGGLEYKAYKIECEILRLKRKAELIQAKKNRQEKVILSEIEETLDFEFAEYEARLNEELGKMNSALERSKGKLLSEEETSEMKKLYRGIVKSLHPDLHPDLSETEIQLFHNAVEAYENGDLNGLRIIGEMIADSVLPDIKSDGLAFLIKEKERLIGLLQIMKERISKIKSEYPYTMKAFVQDPKKIEARKTELRDYIKELNETLAAHAAKIAEMMR